MMKRPRGRPRHDDVLTPAEWRTLDGVRHGLSNTQIARRTGISRDAVKYHLANIVAKLDVANRQALMTWRGYPKTSRPLTPPFEEKEAMSARKEVPTQTSTNDIGQVARTVADIEQSINFYRDIVGLELLYQFPSLAFFDCGGVRLMLQESADPGTESVLYFSVEDIDQRFDALLANGATTTSAPHLIHRHDDGVEEWMAFFEDPEGRPLGLMTTRAANA